MSTKNLAYVGSSTVPPKALAARGSSTPPPNTATLAQQQTAVMLVLAAEAALRGATTVASTADGAQQQSFASGMSSSEDSGSSFSSGLSTPARRSGGLGGRLGSSDSDPDMDDVHRCLPATTSAHNSSNAAAVDGASMRRNTAVAKAVAEVLGMALGFVHWKVALRCRGVSRAWRAASEHFVLLRAVPGPGGRPALAAFIPYRPIGGDGGQDDSDVERRFRLRNARSAVPARDGAVAPSAASGWNCTGCGYWNGENRVACGNRWCQSLAPRFASARRIFMGQLRRENTAAFVEWMVGSVLGEPADALVSVESHRHHLTNRGKGCAWMFFKDQATAQRAQRLNHAAFLDVVGGVEGLWLAMGGPAVAVGALGAVVAAATAIPSRSKLLPRGTVVVELPADSAMAMRKPNDVGQHGRMGAVMARPPPPAPMPTMASPLSVQPSRSSTPVTAPETPKHYSHNPYAGCVMGDPVEVPVSVYASRRSSMALSSSVRASAASPTSPPFVSAPLALTPPEDAQLVASCGPSGLAPLGQQQQQGGHPQAVQGAWNNNNNNNSSNAYHPSAYGFAPAQGFYGFYGYHSGCNHGYHGYNGHHGYPGYSGYQGYQAQACSAPFVPPQPYSSSPNTGAEATAV